MPKLYNKLGMALGELLIPKIPSVFNSLYFPCSDVVHPTGNAYDLNTFFFNMDKLRCLSVSK
jgi:hypothetical protein